MQNVLLYEPSQQCLCFCGRLCSLQLFWSWDLMQIGSPMTLCCHVCGHVFMLRTDWWHSNEAASELLTELWDFLMWFSSYREYFMTKATRYVDLRYCLLVTTGPRNTIVPFKWHDSSHVHIIIAGWFVTVWTDNWFAKVCGVLVIRVWAARIHFKKQVGKTSSQWHNLI